MSIEEFIDKWNVAFESKEQQIEFAGEMRSDIEQIINDRDMEFQSCEFQKCPKCDGQGIVSRPPWVAGDVFEWSSTEITHKCNVCNGSMIIPSPPKQ